MINCFWCTLWSAVCLDSLWLEHQVASLCTQLTDRHREPVGLCFHTHTHSPMFNWIYIILFSGKGLQQMLEFWDQRPTCVPAPVPCRVFMIIGNSPLLVSSSVVHSQVLRQWFSILPSGHEFNLPNKEDCSTPFSHVYDLLVLQDTAASWTVSTSVWTWMGTGPGVCARRECTSSLTCRPVLVYKKTLLPFKGVEFVLSLWDKWAVNLEQQRADLGGKLAIKRTQSLSSFYAPIQNNQPTQHHHHQPHHHHQHNHHRHRHQHNRHRHQQQQRVMAMTVIAAHVSAEYILDSPEISDLRNSNWIWLTLSNISKQ